MNAMVDDKTKRAPQDTKLISLTEDYEIDYWTEKFGVAPEALATAVRRVGHSAQKVDEYLRRVPQTSLTIMRPPRPPPSGRRWCDTL